ncbi:MAG: outer membrane beta-barrel protein [Saprospiraceae bacterium]
MKRKIFVVLLLISIATGKTMAQSFDHSHNIYAGGGISATQLLFRVVENIIPDTANLTTNTTAAYQLTYDYALLDWLSVGGGFSTQSFELQFDQYGAFNHTATLRRTNLGARLLLHFHRDAFDFYSGIRIGFSSWSVNSDIENDAFSALNSFDTFLFSGQLIPLGIRGYLTENIGVSFETGVGAPHFLNFGLNYRL